MKAVLLSQYYSVSPLPSVRYVMKVTADVPWGVDGEGSLDLFVTRVRDLNQVRHCIVILSCVKMCYLLDHCAGDRDAGGRGRSGGEHGGLRLLRPGIT